MTARHQSADVCVVLPASKVTKNNLQCGRIKMPNRRRGLCGESNMMKMMKALFLRQKEHYSNLNDKK